MANDIKSRLQAFIKRLNISERDFCQSIGVSHSYVQNMGSKINVATKNKIVAAYPLLNIDWMLTGSGSMLLDHPAPPPATPEEKKTPAALPCNNDLAMRLLALVEDLRADLAAKDRILADYASAFNRMSEELAAQRSKLDALAQEGPASGGQASPSVPSRVGSPVSAD